MSNAELQRDIAKGIENAESRTRRTREFEQLRIVLMAQMLPWIIRASTQDLEFVENNHIEKVAAAVDDIARVITNHWEQLRFRGPNK